MTSIYNKFILALSLITFLLGAGDVLAGPDRRTELASVIHVAGFENPGSECLQRIEQLEVINKRQFTDEEVIWAAEGYLDSKGLELKPRRHCFTCRMRVLTPHGYVPINQLRVGDVVYSVSEGGRVLVENRVAKIHSATEQAFGTLSAGPTGRNIEVTSEHQFFLPESKSYIKVGKIKIGQALLAIKPQTCEFYLETKSIFADGAGVDTVHTISVEKEPHNFVVEGFVVHNKPIWPL